MNMVIKMIVLSAILLLVNGCTTKELQMFNKVLHDSQVEENRKTQRRIAQCRRDYANGYRSDLNCY